MHKYELSIAIPFYNEEDNIENVVKNLVGELSRNRIDYELVLVNNGSSDSTHKIIENLKKTNFRIRYINIKENHGYGWGIINGLNAANGKFIGFIDGDNQVSPRSVSNAYNKIKEYDAVLCITKRSKRPRKLMRKIASIGYNLILNALFFTNFWDINSKPKIIKQEFYKQLHLYSKDWFVDTEILLKARHKKFKIIEVPIIYKERTKGKSKIKLNIVKELVADIIKFIFHSRFKKTLK